MRRRHSCTTYDLTLECVLLSYYLLATGIFITVNSLPTSYKLGCAFGNISPYLEQIPIYHSLNVSHLGNLALGS